MNATLDEPLLDRTLGDLARSLPGATALMRREGLDFCCGGRQTLREALGDDAAAQAVAEALAALQRRPAAGERDWREASAAALIDHLLERFHARHREQLPELIRLARRVEVVHGHRPDSPQGLADHLGQMQLALEAHMQKEEQVLFPLLRHGSPAFVPGPIAVMRHEHEDHGDALAGMRVLAHDLQLPVDACNTWRALYAGLQQLRDDLMEHIHLENNILFEGLNAGAMAPPAGCGGGGRGCGCGGG